MVLAVIGLFTSIAGITLLFIGKKAYASYLNAWGVDPGRFIAASEDLVLLGLDASIEGISKTFLELLKIGWWKTVLLLFLVFAVIVMLSWLSQLKPKAKLAESRVGNTLLGALLMTFGIALLVPGSLLYAMLLYVMPAVVGESYGKALYKHGVELAKSKCLTPTAYASCESIVKGEKQIACGVRIVGSTSAKAIFDLKLSRAITIPIEDSQTYTSMGCSTLPIP